MPNYDLLETPWADKSESIQKIIIESGVTTIGDNAFFNCDNLNSVTIPNTVTGIGNLAFADAGLTNITIPESVTFIGERAFDTTAITSVKLPKNVTYIGERAFAIPPFGSSGRTQGLSDITVDTGNPSYSSQDGVLFNKDKSEILVFPSAKRDAYTIPQSVKTIGNSAFAYSQSEDYHSFRCDNDWRRSVF